MKKSHQTISDPQVEDQSNRQTEHPSQSSDKVVDDDVIFRNIRSPSPSRAPDHRLHKLDMPDCAIKTKTDIHEGRQKSQNSESVERFFFHQLMMENNNPKYICKDCGQSYMSLGKLISHFG